MHLHCLVLDGVYRCGTDDVSNFVKASAPTDDELHAMLHKVITQLMKMLARRGVLVEDMGQTHLHEFVDAGERARTLRPLQAAVMPCRARRARGRALRPAQTVHRTVCVRAQHHALGHEPAGVHVASGRAGAAAAAAPDPFRCPHEVAVRSERTPAARTWGVGPEPEAAGPDGAAGTTQSRASRKCCRRYRAVRSRNRPSPAGTHQPGKVAQARLSGVGGPRPEGDAEPEAGRRQQRPRATTRAAGTTAAGRPKRTGPQPAACGKLHGE